MEYNTFYIAVSDYTEDAKKVAGLFDIELPPNPSEDVIPQQLRTAVLTESGRVWCNVSGIARNILIEVLEDYPKNVWYSVEEVYALSEELK